MAHGGKQAPGAGRLALHEPRWLISGGLAALATVLVCWPAWPGYMSYDSLQAWSQAIGGVRTALWPPFHAYLFGLSRSIGAGAWGLFIAQTFFIFLAANLILSLLARRTWLAVTLCLAFMASFVWITPQLGVVMTQWRDVTTTSFAVLGVALWLLGARYRAVPLLVAAALAFGGAAALRYNTLPLVAFALALMVWRPLLGERLARSARLLVAAAAILGLGLAWASTQWRLPDLRRLPAGYNAMVTQQFDLIGISACSGSDLLPRGMGDASVATIRHGYDPRHLNLSLQHAGLTKLPPSDANSRVVGAAWRRALIAHPVCYLSHRRAVFAEQMALKRDHVFYPTHGAIDPNPYGLRLAHPKASTWLNAKVVAGSAPMSRRAFWLYVAALPLVALAARGRRDQAALLVALLAGAYAYAGALLLAGPAADARYIFPSNVFCVLAILLSLGALVPKRFAG